MDKGDGVMTGSGMAEYTVRLKDCDYVTRSLTLARREAMEEAGRSGSCRMEVRYPDGGGYIVEYKDGQGSNVNYLPRDWED